MAGAALASILYLYKPIYSTPAPLFRQSAPPFGRAFDVATMIVSMALAKLEILPPATVATPNATTNGEGTKI
ncbi:unnamed protein product, partial [Iphiclides podalirius]